MLFEVDNEGHPTPLPDDTALPDGAYSTLRTYGGGQRVLRLWQHIARLSDSVTLQGRPALLDPARVRLGLADALRQAGPGETRVRLTFAPPRLFVALAPFKPLPEALYTQGVACATVPVRRHTPHAKDTRFLTTAAQARTHLGADIHEGLMLDEDGALLEGLSSNFFGTAGGVLRTEGERVLAGVTRALVLELAAPLLPVRFEPVRHTELAALNEAFLTSTSRGVLPVVRVDGIVIGDGRPGPLTRALIARLAEMVEREAHNVLGT